MLTCRLLSTADADTFIALRLRACREEPASFLEDDAEIASHSPKRILKYFENGWIAGAFNGDAMVGMAGIYRHKGLKVRHKGTVWGVYTAPEARGQRISTKLIEMLLKEAKDAGIELVHLSTNVATPITQAIYQGLGFQPWGVEKRIMKLRDGTYIDDVMMIKFL